MRFYASLRVMSLSFPLLATTHLLAQALPRPSLPAPLTNGDGLRYPLVMAPVTLNLVGSGIYPVKGSDGRIHLAYALQVTNSWSIPATLQSITVVDPANNDQPTGANRVLDIKNQDVTGQAKLFTLPGTMDKQSYTRQIPGGQSSVMFFDVTYQDIRQVPRAVAFRFTVSTPPTPVGTVHTFVSHPIAVGRDAMVISPPLKGSGWVNGNGCCLEIGPHRFVTNSMNGSLDPSETFAIDWVRIDIHGVAFKGDGSQPEDWFGYGAEVVAAAPGTVVEVVRNLPNVPPGKNPDGLTMEQIAGNRVILDMGQGRYAMYAHLAPGSVQLHVGDRVQRGQRLGLLGNTGNTTAPHLHFQIMDRPSSLDDTSLPFVFDRMDVKRRVPLDLTQLEDYMDRKIPMPMDTKDAAPRASEMPLSGDVVEFP